MIVVGKPKLAAFKARHALVGGALDAWLAEAEEADWKTPQDIKDRYASASILPGTGGSHVIFNIKGNRYRLLVQVAFRTRIVTILKVGTHEEYDAW